MAALLPGLTISINIRSQDEAVGCFGPKGFFIDGRTGSDRWLSDWGCSNWNVFRWTGFSRLLADELQEFEMTDVTYDELRGMAVAVTDANTKAKAKAEKREPSLPDGWSRARIISNLVEMMVDVPDDHGAMLNRYQATLQEIQRDRRVEDPEVQLPTELVNQIKEDPLFAHLSDGNLVLVASSWFALEEIWWALFREEPDDPFES